MLADISAALCSEDKREAPAVKSQRLAAPSEQKAPA